MYDLLPISGGRHCLTAPFKTHMTFVEMTQLSVFWSALSGLGPELGKVEEVDLLRKNQVKRRCQVSYSSLVHYTQTACNLRSSVCQRFVFSFHCHVRCLDSTGQAASLTSFPSNVLRSVVHLQLLVHVPKCYISAVLFLSNGQYDISAIKGLFKQNRADHLWSQRQSLHLLEDNTRSLRFCSDPEPFSCLAEINFETVGLNSERILTVY